MATVDDENIHQRERNLREHKEILSQCFTEVRSKLDEREAELTEQLEKEFIEDEMRYKKLASDKQQLTSALEQLQTTLTSETLLETGGEAIQLMQNKIKELGRRKMRVQFCWSKHHLFVEISKIGEFVLVPLLAPYHLDSTHLLAPYHLDSTHPDPKTECIGLVTPPSRQEQKAQTQKLLNRPLDLKTPIHYLICSQWYNQWKRFVSYDVTDLPSCESYPCPINNTALVEDGKLKRDRTENVDYTLLPDPAWQRLVSWYGTTRGLIAVKRRVVSHGQSVKQPKVEVYPLEFKVYLFPNEKQSHSISMSRVDTVDTLEKRLRRLFKIVHNTPTHIYRQVKGLNYTFPFEPITDTKSQIQEVLLLQEDNPFQEYNLLIATQTNGHWSSAAELKKHSLTLEKLLPAEQFFKHLLLRK